MSNFLGFKQVLFSQYSGLTKEQKLGYLWLVSNETTTGTTNGSYDIYFGSRKYSGNGTTLTNLRNAFNGFLDKDGAFVLPVAQEFTSFDESNVSNFADILYALDAAIKANQDELELVYTKEEVDGLISGVNTTIATYVKDVKVKLSDDETVSLEHGADGSVTIDLTSFATKDELASAGKVQSVKVDGESVVDADGVANISISGKADVSVVNAVSDRVDALEAIKHATDVKYDSETKYINLYAGEEKLGNGFDASPFLVDGMLKSVEFVKDENENNTTVLRFTFNTDGGDKVLDVDFAEYVDTYHADGTSIELDSSTNTFSVKEVDASKTVLGSTIQIAGGPLANDIAETNEVWPWTEGGNKVIPSGKTMEEILTALFLKVVSGTTSWSAISYSPSLSAPSAKLSKTGTVEVGTELTATATTTSTVSSNTRKSDGSGTQGHFDALDGTWKSSTTKTTVSKTGNHSGTTSITTYWNGTATTIDNGVTKLYATKEGANTLKVDQSGITAYVERLPETTIYASTNTKSILTGSSSTLEDTGSTPPVTTALTSSSSVTVNAYYKYYVGFATSVPSDTAGITALTEYTGFLSGGTNTYTIPSSGKITCPAANNLVIALPSNYSVTDIVNGFDLPALSEFSTTTVTYTLPNGTEMDYKLYYKLCAVATEFKSIKFKK